VPSQLWTELCRRREVQTKTRTTASSTVAGCEIQVHGSSNLIQTLLRHDLVDALRIWQFRVVLGTGKRLFGDGTIPRSFRLIETQLNTTGAVLHAYERTGDLRYGEVEVGQETVVFEWCSAKVSRSRAPNYRFRPTCPPLAVTRLKLGVRCLTGRS
jgi:hypothetical protein